MKISALRLFNVKRFAGRGVAVEGIGDGVNVLCAVNEFGKSTSFEALHALFFQPHSSTAGDVRNLRPYSGGNPLVEADIETKTGRYRITKQFYGGRFAKVLDRANDRLVAQADEAESFISELVGGGTAGPAGLLWVRQGLTGIERRGRSELDDETRVRTSLLESVQGEVEAVTGGRRMAEIMAAVEEALGALVTPTGRPRAGERYAAAIEERARLEAETQKLGAEVALLRDALDRRDLMTKRLTELDRGEDREERRKAVEIAEAAFNAATSQAETLRAAEAELRLAQEQRGVADRELKAFREGLERAADAGNKLADATRRRTEALAHREAVGEATAKARADSDAAEAREVEARAMLARLDAAMKARDAAEELAGLEKRLSASEAARQGIEEGEAALALIKLPESAVSELEALDSEIAKLKALGEAARPSLAIVYEPGAPVVSLDGNPLEEGSSRSYGARADLSIPGVGVVTLRSNIPAPDEGRLAEALERRRVLLDSMGVSDLAAARGRQLEAQRKEGDLRELRARLSILAPDGLANLRKETARGREAAAGPIELKEDPVQGRAAHAAAEARRLETRQALRETEPLQIAAIDAVAAAQTALATIEAECSRIEAFLGPDPTRAEREKGLVESLAAMEANLSARRTTVEGLRSENIDLASAEATLRRLRSVAATAEKEISRLREDIAALTAEIRTRSDDAVEEKWREASDALAAANVRAMAYDKEVAVLQRLRAALETARGHARETYLLPVMTELRPLLGLLFDDASITFDEKTLLPQKLLRNGQEEDVDRLSGGMREQLSVLTRLAFAHLLAKDGRPAPVILDDALVYSDDDRIERMFDALHRQARQQQIIVFSCRQRAFQKLGGNVLQMSDWSRED